MKRVLLFIVLLLFPFSIYALEYPKLNSKNIIVYDLTEDRILYEKNSEDTTAIASLTKIATTITAIETIDDLDEEVIITKDILNNVEKGASVAGLKENDKVTYRDLLYAIILPSGADAAQAIAILSSGNEEAYVKKMNYLVNKLGLNNTHFNNVDGLNHEDNYSTTQDVLKLLTYSLDNPLFKEIYTTKEYTLSNGLKIKTTLNRYNVTKLDISKIQGSKTGFTQEAGYCLSSLSNIKGYNIVIITIKGEYKNNKYYNIIDTKDVIDFIDNNYIDYTIIEKDKMVKKLPIDIGKNDYYNVMPSSTIKALLPIDYDKRDIKIQYDGLQKLSYKNKKGDIIGTISYYYKDELLTKEDVILEIDIKISISKLITKHAFLLMILLAIVLLIFYFVINKDIILKLIKDR